MSKVFTTIILCLCSCSNSVLASNQNQDLSRVLLEDVPYLSFSKNKMTLGNRLPSIPQMKCLNKYDISKINKITCNNLGVENNNINWECNTDIDEKYKLDKVEILCEGYESPEDPYIFKGSCSIQYIIKPKHTPGLLSVFKGFVVTVFLVIALNEAVINPYKYPSQDFIAGAAIGSLLMYSSKGNRYASYSTGISRTR